MKHLALLFCLLPAVATAQQQTYNGPSTAQIDTEIADADATIGQLLILKARGSAPGVDGVIQSMQTAKQKLMEMRNYAVQAER